MCQASRESLETQLVASRYGQDPNIFNMFFVPNENPPRCIYCRRMVAEHASVAQAGMQPPNAVVGTPYIVVGAPQPYVVGAPQPYVVGPQMMKPTVVVQPFGTMAAPLMGSPGVPFGLVQGPQVDVFQCRDAMAFAIASAILSTVAVIMLVSFSASGMFQWTIAPVVGPVILLILACVFSLLPTRITAEFDKQRRELRYTRTRVCYPCMSETHTVQFANIQGVQAVASNMRVNGVPMMQVMLIVGGMAGGLLLQRDNMFNARATCGVWSMYLQTHGISAQVVGGAPMAIFA